MPIAAYAEDIHDSVLEHGIVAIDAPTGSGKTRFLPYYFAQRGWTVRVSVPTIVGVESAYEFHSESSDISVGMATSGNVRYSSTDDLVYATTGYVGRVISHVLKPVPLRPIVLFIDEIHNMTVQTTMLMGLASHYGIDHVVLTTATFNPDDVSPFFPDVHRVKIPHRGYSIEEIFLDADSPMDDDPNPRIGDIVEKEQRHNGIVFRPGVREVTGTVDYLSARFPGRAFLPAYSQLSDRELDKIFTAPGPKVVVGTSVIESSVTIRDVAFVVDDMLEKIPATGVGNGLYLRLQPISRASSEQRKGRTGRTMDGRNYKLVSRSRYNRLDEYKTRDVDRVPIDDVILDILGRGLDPGVVLHIPSEQCDAAMTRLDGIGMMRDGVLTDAGRYVSALPLDVEHGYMVYLASPGCRKTATAVASLAHHYKRGYERVLSQEPDEADDEFEARTAAARGRYDSFVGGTVIHTLTNIANDWLSSDQPLNEYCDARKLDRKKFAAFCRTYKRVLAKVDAPRDAIGDGDEMVELFKRSHPRRFTRYRGKYVDDDDNWYRCDLKCPEIAGSNTIEFSTSRGSLRIVGLAVPA